MRSWVIRASVSLAILACVLAFVPLRSVVAALRQMNLWACAGGLSALYVGHFLSAIKLRLLVGTSRVPLGTCVRAQYAALVASLGFLGMAGGDLARLAYVTRSAGVQRTALAAVTDRMVDATALATVIGIALPLAGWPPVLQRADLHLGWWIALFVAAGTIGGTLVVRFARRSALIARLRQARSELLAMRWQIAGAFGIACVVQTIFVSANIAIATNLGVAIGLAPWFVAWPLAKLTSILPISLGGIGVREAAVVAFLVSFGAPADRVLAAALVWQVLIGVSGVSGLAITQLLPIRTPEKVVQYQWID